LSCQNRQEISDFDMRDFTVVIANMVSVRGKGRIVDSKLHYFLDGTLVQTAAWFLLNLLRFMRMIRKSCNLSS